jgi:glycerophosphoryl diester phosphodiesterase
MDEQRLASGLGLTLQRAGVAVYVHTVNDVDTAADYLANWGASGVYTDTLTLAMVGRLRMAERAGSD